MNRKIQELYENIYKENNEEIVPEQQSNAFSKFGLNDYMEIVYKDSPLEEGRGHGDVGAVFKLMRKGIKKGLIKDYKENGNVYTMYSAVDNSLNTVHRNDTGLHPLRRYIEYLLDVQTGRVPPNSKYMGGRNNFS